MTEVLHVHIPEKVIPDKRLGRHIEHDERSREYGIVEELVTLVHRHHIRHGHIFDQGNLGSCTGNAGAGSVNTVPIWKTGHHLLVEKDAVSIYEQATVIDGVPGSYPPDDTGSSGLAVCKVMKKESLITGYQHAFTVGAAMQALQKQSVMIGINWYEGFDSPDNKGLVKISGEVRGGHEVEVNEYIPTTTASPLDALLGICNSWGISYGVKGRFFMSVRTFTQLMSEQGDCTVPLSL